MIQESVDIWVKIIKEDQKHISETGWSYFTGPQNNPCDEAEDSSADMDVQEDETG